MNVIGFDTSTKAIHFALYKGNNEFAIVGELEGPEHVDGLKEDWGIDCAYIEEVPYVNNFNTLIKLSHVIGMLSQQLVDRDVPYEMISVAKWKQLSVGNGQAKKTEVKRVMILTTNVDDSHPQDVYDACGVAVAGMALEKEKELG